jgi:hypothetical protein
MNDNELSTMVRESVTDVHSATPIAQIISRGRAVRARRRAPALAGAGAVLAGTALAVTALMPSGHPGVQASRHRGSSVATARLAAWTVAKQANGDVNVTIRQLKNPAGLQSTLRADGVPVIVNFAGQSLAGSCEFYPMNGNVLNAVARTPSPSSVEGGTLFVINPAALPAGAGLAMDVGAITHTVPGGGTMITNRTPVSLPSSPPPGTAGGVSQSVVGMVHGHVELLAGLSITPVYASQRCTG